MAVAHLSLICLTPVNRHFFRRLRNRMAASRGNDVLQAYQRHCELPGVSGSIFLVVNVRHAGQMSDNKANQRQLCLKSATAGADPVARRHLTPESGATADRCGVAAHEEAFSDTELAQMCDTHAKSPTIGSQRPTRWHAVTSPHR